MRQRIDSIRQAIDRLKTSKLYTLYEKCNVRRDAGDNLLAQMAEQLDRQIAAVRQELAALEAETQ